MHVKYDAEVLVGVIYFSESGSTGLLIFPATQLPQESATRRWHQLTGC
jgi:hypothetical protein